MRSDDEIIIRDQRKAKISVMIVLLFISCFLTYFFHFIFKIEIIFTHFFYIPIILSCFWWKKKGLVVPIFLAVFYISFASWAVSFEEMHFIEHTLRGLIFLLIGVVISLLTEKIFKIQEVLKGSEEKYREAYNLVNFYQDLFAHDMNNILQAIISSAEFYSMFRNDPKNLKDLGDIAEVVKKHARRGASLISNVRILSKLDEKEVVLNPIEILNILNQSVEHAVSGFQERKVKIDVNGLSKDMKVLGDELLIDIFDNVLSNAVKYNDNEEEVKVEVNVSKIIENDTQYIEFKFSDYGMGVPDDKKGTLFKRSYTEDISKRGMGMGLSLVKKIVDKYEGRIWVEDRVKGDYTKGSNFIVMLKEAL